MEPSSGGQQLIVAKVYKWLNGASPYSQYCGGIRKPMCVYYGRRLSSPSVQLAVHTLRLFYAATILIIWTGSIEPFVYFS